MDECMRIGQGYDVHKLVEDRDLIIGGVKIPYEKGLLGHSDADVLLHAISDSLLGAAAIGDIGKLFPDSKDKNIECAYHALVHYAADEDLRYKDIEYREAQDDYLEFLAQTLSEGKDLPKNIIEEYKPYYKGTAQVWLDGINGFWKEWNQLIFRFYSYNLLV